MNKKELKKEVKTWLKEIKDIKIVDMNDIVAMDEDSWIGVDSYHCVYHIIVCYCTMTLSIQMLSDTMVHKIDYYDMNNNFRRMK